LEKPPCKARCKGDTGVMLMIVQKYHHALALFEF
jgi:hypothetical protein